MSTGTGDTTKQRLSPRAMRRIYPYSLIPGGVGNEKEFAEALASDAVVRNHYRDVGAALSNHVLAADERMYASYRIGDEVYWTKQPILIHEGELLLADGKTIVRARCGNRLSRTPQQPTRFFEPPEISTDVADGRQILAGMPPEIASDVNQPEFETADLPGAPGTNAAAFATPAVKSGDESARSLPALLWPEPKMDLPLIVPEPGTWALVVSGLGAIAFSFRRFR